MVRNCLKKCFALVSRKLAEWLVLRSRMLPRSLNSCLVHILNEACLVF